MCELFLDKVRDASMYLSDMIPLCLMPLTSLECVWCCFCSSDVFSGSKLIAFLVLELFPSLSGDLHLGGCKWVGIASFSDMLLTGAWLLVTDLSLWDVPVVWWQLILCKAPVRLLEFTVLASIAGDLELGLGGTGGGFLLSPTSVLSNLLHRFWIEWLFILILLASAWRDEELKRLSASLSKELEEEDRPDLEDLCHRLRMSGGLNPSSSRLLRLRGGGASAGGGGGDSCTRKEDFGVTGIVSSSSEIKTSSLNCLFNIWGTIESFILPFLM